MSQFRTFHADEPKELLFKKFLEEEVSEQNFCKWDIKKLCNRQTTQLELERIQDQYRSSDRTLTEPTHNVVHEQLKGVSFEKQEDGSFKLIGEGYFGRV